MLELSHPVNATTQEPAAGSPRSARQIVEELRRATLNRPVDDFLGRSGKRIRAGLVHIAFQAGGGQGAAPDQLIQFVEMLHAGSLIIDDIQDNSRNRRKRETMHLQFGVPLAINTGNWLYFAALEQLADCPAIESSLGSVMNKALRVIRQCHEGQALDLGARFDRLPAWAIPEAVATISRLKTGALTSLAAWLGGQAAGASPERLKQLDAFGMQLGIGLQMQNDLMELRQAALEDVPSDDLRNRRVTWPWAWLATHVSNAEFNRLIDQACNPSICLEQAARELIEPIEAIAIGEIQQNLNAALHCLVPLHPAIRKQITRIIRSLELTHV